MYIGVPDVSQPEKIGEGGFGVVYKAYQDAFGRTVAVKVLQNTDLNEEARVRFAREVRAIGSLSGHPNIVSVYTHGTTDEGAPYLVMEFCERGSYGDALRKGRRFSWEEATDVAVAIAGALDTAHRAAILHRDVKPDNILIDKWGVPKLADFGIARATDQKSITATGMFIGSAAYIAPEIVVGEQPSPSSDLYALASTVHALVTGESPFVRATDTSIIPLLHRIASEPPPNLRNHGVPGPVADLLVHAMAKDPADRPGSCAEFAQALRQARSNAGAPSAHRHTPPATPIPFRGDSPDATLAAPGTPPPIHPGQWPAAAASSNPARQAGPPFAAQPPPNGPPPHGSQQFGFHGGPGGSPPPTRGGRRGLLIALALVAVLVLVGGAIWGVVAFTKDDGPTGGTGTAADDRQPRLTDDEAIERLVLTNAQIDDIDGTSFQPADTGPLITEVGFCNVQLDNPPTKFAKQDFSFGDAAAGDSVIQVISVGAVFETARAAESYQRATRRSADCGTWTDNTGSHSVTESSLSPTLVGCQCQNVAVFDEVITYQDGTSLTVFQSLAQQDRYLTNVFLFVDASLAGNDEVVTFWSRLVDAAVAQVSEVAEEAKG